MRRSLFALVLSLLCLSPVLRAVDPWPGVVKHVASALVSVENAEGSCSGSVIDTARHYVLTAAHCDGAELYADRVVAHVLAKDTHEDLLVLKVEDLDPARTALTLATKNPEIQQPVLACGFGYALERPFYRSARIMDNKIVVPGLTQTYIGTDATFIGGMSGGPVVNDRGEIVAIVQRGDNASMGIGVGAEMIRERIGRFFAATSTGTK